MLCRKPPIAVIVRGNRLNINFFGFGREQNRVTGGKHVDEADTAEVAAEQIVKRIIHAAGTGQIIAVKTDFRRGQDAAFLRKQRIAESDFAQAAAVDNFAADGRFTQTADNPVIAAVFNKLRHIALQAAGVIDFKRIINLLLNIGIRVADFRRHAEFRTVHLLRCLIAAGSGGSFSRSGRSGNNV